MTDPQDGSSGSDSSPNASEVVVAVEAPRVSEERRLEFTRLVDMCHKVLASIATGAGLPRRIEVILTTDFEQAVRLRLRSANGGEAEAEFFEVERIAGGRVAAKNVSLDETLDNVLVLFDADGWLLEMTDPGHRQMQAISLIAHELAHTALNRVELLSGVTKDVVYPSSTPGEIARSLSRILNDEYRADSISDALVHATVTTTRDGVVAPVHIWDTSSDSYIRGLQDALFEAYAEGPGTVQDYRQYHGDIAVMFQRLVGITQGVLTNYIHARALADCAGVRVLLDDPAISNLPFVRLYLADAVLPFLEAIRDGPLLPSPSDWHELDARVIAVGEPMVREIWRRFGLTFDEPLGREPYMIHVGEPIVA